MFLLTTLNILLGEAQVDHLQRVGLISETHDEIVKFDVVVAVVDQMQVSYKQKHFLS